MKKVNDGPNSRAGIGHDRPASVRLHPFVYKSICVLAIVFLFSAAWGFAGDDYTGYLIAVVAGLFFVALALPFTLWRIGRSHRIRSKPGADAPGQETFGDWASGEFQGWQDREKAGNAAVEVLLPIAAVAFGMVAFGIVSHFT
jgi:hypothetical protein